MWYGGGRNGCLPHHGVHRQCSRRAGVVCGAACAVAELEERGGRSPRTIGWGARGGAGGAAAGVGTAAGGASVSLRTLLHWALLPTRVTFPGRTALSL